MSDFRTTPETILVVDDHYAAEASSQSQFYDRNLFLADFGHIGFNFSFSTAWDADSKRYSPAAVMSHLDAMAQPPRAILLDIRFGEDEFMGLDILQALSLERPHLPVIIMTSTPREDLIHDCIKLGSVDYLVKPIQPVILKQTLDRYVGVNVQYWLIGQDESFLAAVDQVARAAEGGVSSVLLLGASGTGKELFARYLHRHGTRRTGPFQAVHIPSIPEQLVEGELFGYCKGAFTGAVRDEPGRLSRASGGVLFLDEIGDLSSAAQAALLRVLESREVSRLGDGRLTQIDIQIVAATNVNLANHVKSNTFRFDLYSRLGGNIIHLPTLAERKTDWDMLARHLFRRAYLERDINRSFLDIPERGIAELMSQPWNGNVRELWNYVQKVMDVARGQTPKYETFRAALDSTKAQETPRDDEYAGAGISPTGVQRGDGLTKLPDNIVRSPQEYLQGLILSEISLLKSALELTKDPVTGLYSRAKAAALLKGKMRCSTNEFDRWLWRLLNRLPREKTVTILEDNPELAAGYAAQGLAEADE